MKSSLTSNFPLLKMLIATSNCQHISDFILTNYFLHITVLDGEEWFPAQKQRLACWACYNYILEMFKLKDNIHFTRSFRCLLSSGTQLIGIISKQIFYHTHYNIVLKVNSRINTSPFEYTFLEF